MTFIPDLPTLAAFTIASIIVGITPGPDMTLFLGRTLQHGKSAGHAAVYGAMSGLIVHTVLVAFGISALLAASQTGFMILKVVGALYLAWLAIAALRGKSALKIEKATLKPEPFLQTWLTGVGINLLNPKIVLFFITFLPQFVDASSENAIQTMLFLGGYFIFIVFFICIGIVAIANKFVKKLNDSPRIMRMIDYVFAGIFSAFAIKILTAQRL